ncbi:MAG: hypothetical protein C4317_09370, partial [Acidimicrobiia bacterium]
MAETPPDSDRNRSAAGSGIPDVVSEGSSQERSFIEASIPTTPEEDIESKIRRIEEMVHNAKSMPLSSSVLVPKDELLMYLADVRESLPQELRHARWILRERDEFIARARREAELIVEEAQSEASRIVSETEIMREAEWKAGLVLSEAEERARSLKAETDGYIDSKLASFEMLLRRMLETIVAGRERLRAVPEVETSPSRDAGEVDDVANQGQDFAVRQPQRRSGLV